MKRLLYIGHSYHVKTNSTGFLLDLLRTRFSVDVMTDDAWAGGERPDVATINAGNYDAVVFFQLIPRAELARIKCDNITFCPMYDGCDINDYEYWYDVRRCKILNFSRLVHDTLAKYGMNQHLTQYYPEPKHSVTSGADVDGAFFWQRREAINWATIKSLIGNESIGPIHIHRAVDPGESFMSPTSFEELRYGITYSDWFETREEYLAKVLSRKLYFSPRPREGIGLSFLEAMALGRAVVAPNCATMNEYIRDGENGYLYDVDNPSMLDLSARNKVCEAAKDSVADGRRKWEAGIQGLLDFVDASVSSIPAMRSPRHSPNKNVKRFILKIVRKIYRMLDT